MYVIFKRNQRSSLYAGHILCITLFTNSLFCFLFVVLTDDSKLAVHLTLFCQLQCLLATLLVLDLEHLFLTKSIHVHMARIISLVSNWKLPNDVWLVHCSFIYDTLVIGNFRSAMVMMLANIENKKYIFCSDINYISLIDFLSISLFFIGRGYTHWETSSKKLVCNYFEQYLLRDTRKKLPGMCRAIHKRVHARTF